MRKFKQKKDIKEKVQIEKINAAKTKYLTKQMYTKRLEKEK